MVNRCGIIEKANLLFFYFLEFYLLYYNQQRIPINMQDISTIIDLHFEEMTELEQVIARYFLQVEVIENLSSSINIKKTP